MKPRIAEIDILRGFAILLILPANIAIFSGYTVASNLDYSIVWIFRLLFDGVLYSMFTLLFGFGMAIQSGAEGFKDKWFSRMKTLFYIGIAHGILLSQADILAIYALLGCLLYLVRNWQTKYLLAIACMLLAIPFTSNALLWFGDTPMQAAGAMFDPRFAGSLSQVFAGRFHQWQLYFLGQLLINFPNFFAMMLFGLVLARIPVQQWDTAEFRRLGFFGFLAMVGYATIYTFRDGSIVNWGNALITIGAPMLAMGYIGVLLWTAKRCHWIDIFIAPGRLSLTLYIMQSLIANVFFYGMGFYGHLSISQLLPFLILVWIGQLTFSFIYLRYVDMGPVERLSHSYLSTVDR
jgi:uncharacterized protein